MSATTMPGGPVIAMGRALAMPGRTPEEVLHAAASGAAPGGDDPVDRAALAAASEAGDLRNVTVSGYDPPQAGRRYSVSTLKGAGRSAPQIARGDFVSVAQLCQLDAAGREAASGLARAARDAGYRPWAIASSSGKGDWSLLGVIPVRASQPSWGDRATFVFVPVWSFLLRFLHWSWALLIAILIVTGLEIQTMALSSASAYVVPGQSQPQIGFFFGYVRLVHFICGWLLFAAVLARFLDALFTRNRFEDWRALIPFKSGRDVRGFFHELGNYVFLRNDEGKKYIGHDPLAQLSFTFIYLVMIGAIVSGFAIYGMYEPRQWFFSWFEWIIRSFGGNETRLFHVTMMWLIILFIPVHIYLVVRADGYARAGSLSSMLSGGRWVRKGATFEDAPDPEAINVHVKG